MSHTISAQIELRNTAALDYAVKQMNGQILGQGTHRLFSTQETGFGFRLPNWRCPLVARSNGTLAYDDYNGAWGNVSDLDKLKAHYALAAARAAAEAQGWYCEESAGQLIIYHPDGGTLTVDATGVIDASGFVGSACELASKPIAEALGEITSQTKKAEYNSTHQEATDR
jgi:hypothetical protein